MYESLTKYLDEFTGTEFGTWIIDKKNDGTPEHPLQFPFVDYSRVVDQFIHDVYSFVDGTMDFDLNEKDSNGTKWLIADTTAKIT